MQREDQVRLRHMRDAAREAVSFVEGRERADLDRDRQLLLAVVMSIGIVGEAAARVSAATREQHPAIPWSVIVGMRNRLVHAYFDIDTTIVWATVTEDLPGLISSLEDVLHASG